MAAWDAASSGGEYGTSSVVYMAIFLLIMACFFSLLIVLCAFHSRKSEQKYQGSEEKYQGEEYSEASYEATSAKALVSSVEKTEGEMVWQRTILMGERCRPPNFSGAILYDTNGNLLPQFPSRTPRNSFTYQLPSST